MRWMPASGRGEVHTYTVVHHVYDPSWADKIPYVIAVVRLDEGPFFHSDLVGCDPADVHVGMRVEVGFERLDDDTADTGDTGETDDTVIPRFHPAG
jgi:uncharacterized OB-fold protein